MKKYKFIIIGIIMFISILGVGVFSTIYNWNKTSPERLTDPLNWVITVVLITIYLITYLIIRYKK